ncbi:hypothetical protein MACK_003286 [Theileria orientalis]|uniref:Uncharacterized protein n=1 Tax=Theileria orientalis TaxID=68886 RepID=A0A976SIG5_THEOR|nr:hypothetical protein MACK_003286 [Theileria orientalis]
MSTGIVQPATAHNQRIDQVTVGNEIVHNQDQERSLLETEESHTQTGLSLCHDEEKGVTNESERMPETLVVKRGEAGHNIEMVMDDPQSNIEVDITYQSTGSIGQDLLRKGAESVYISENQGGKRDQDILKDDEQSGGRNPKAEEGVGRLPETPCIGQGEGTTHYVNTGMKGFDHFMNGAINYAKSNPGVVSTAGVGSLLGCAGGGPCGYDMNANYLYGSMQIGAQMTNYTLL